MVRFRVTKGSAFPFECSSDTVSQSDELRALATRVEDLEALDISDVNIVKRLDLADIDRIVALSHQHPPQCVVSPASAEHTRAFEEFTAYLKQRQRAGVATLASGFLLLLTPIPNWDSSLRCLVVKAKDSELDTASILSRSSVKGEPNDMNTTRSSRSHEDPAPSVSPPRKRQKHESPRAHAAEQPADAFATDSPTLPSPRSRDARFAWLRQELHAFNALRHQVLQEWSSR